MRPRLEHFRQQGVELEGAAAEAADAVSGTSEAIERNVDAVAGLDAGEFEEGLEAKAAGHDEVSATGEAALEADSDRATTTIDALSEHGDEAGEHADRSGAAADEAGRYTSDDPRVSGIARAEELLRELQEGLAGVQSADTVGADESKEQVADAEAQARAAMSRTPTS